MLVLIESFYNDEFDLEILLSRALSPEIVLVR